MEKLCGQLNSSIQITCVCVCVCACVCVQGSEDQLKEVWQEGDGLDPQDFEPKTFFKLHGNHRCHICQEHLFRNSLLTHLSTTKP